MFPTPALDQNHIDQSPSSSPSMSMEEDGCQALLSAPMVLELALASIRWIRDVVFYCYTRVKAYREKKLHWIANLESTYISVGFANWKQAKARFSAHKSSACHKDAVLKTVLSHERSMILVRLYHFSTPKTSANGASASWSYSPMSIFWLSKA